jgi:7-carboxy-7-deazaguanine synthase
MIKVNEIYRSIQGESSFAGLPCVFVRQTYCNLRCTYCDSEYAFFQGTDMAIPQIVATVKAFNIPLVEVTGGEPLVQKESGELITALADSGLTVLVETSGSISIKEVDRRARLIMDLKCPSSGMLKKNLYENIDYLKPVDEVKFVMGTREDYEWAKVIIGQYDLAAKVPILFSCVFGSLEPSELVQWMLDDHVPARFQLQMHKFIWKPEQRGV